MLAVLIMVSDVGINSYSLLTLPHSPGWFLGVSSSLYSWAFVVGTIPFMWPVITKGSSRRHRREAVGITAYLRNGGTLEHAQQIAAHQPRTTKLYDRTKDEISLDEVERIKF
jgi:hypothetical protein